MADNGVFLPVFQNITPIKEQGIFFLKMNFENKTLPNDRKSTLHLKKYRSQILGAFYKDIFLVRFKY